MTYIRMAMTVVGLSVSMAISQAAIAQSTNTFEPFEGELIGLVPSLYGGDGFTLLASPRFDHSAHFTADALEQLNQLSVNLGSLATPSFNLTPSDIYEYDSISEEYIAVETSRSPSFNSEHANTIGRGRTGIGAAITTRRFSKINSVELDEIVIDLEHLDVATPGANTCVGGPPDACHIFELDIVRLNIDVDFRETSLLFGLTQGLTDTLEVSVLMPMIKTELKTRSVASIIRDDTAANISFTVHSFDPAEGADHSVDALSAKHFGIGDITVSAKQEITGSWIPPEISLAAGAEIRLPTGSEGNLQGIPNIGISPKLLATANWDLAGVDIQTNANIGYVINATRAGDDALRFAFGSTFEPDLKVFGDNVAFATNIIGWKPLDPVDLTGLDSGTSVSHDHDGHEHASTNEALRSDTATQLDVAFGIHMACLKRGYVFYEAKLPLNEVGLRANLTHSFGMQVPF